MILSTKSCIFVFVTVMPSVKLSDYSKADLYISTPWLSFVPSQIGFSHLCSEAQQACCSCTNLGSLALGASGSLDGTFNPSSLSSIELKPCVVERSTGYLSVLAATESRLRSYRRFADSGQLKPRGLFIKVDGSCDHLAF